MINHAPHITIRLATPEAIGSGFYLKKYDVIVTAEHIIRGHDQIIIEGMDAPRQLAQVIFTDPLKDLALLKVAAPLGIVEVEIHTDPQEDQPVVSYAFPFTECESTESGFIDDGAFDFHGHPHIMHDAVLSNAANGSGLFTPEGKLLGMNNFITWKGRNVGMTLPITSIMESTETNISSGYRISTLCSHCDTIVNADLVEKCSNCGELLNLKMDTASVTVKGMALTIEGLLASMGYTLALARIGSDHWEVRRGSAAVNITYYKKNGLIIGDAYMCKLPDQSNTDLYEYLLRQNHEMDNLAFSVKGDDIILSLLIYDRYLNEQTGTELLTNLLEKADHFDNILVDQYQCLWTSSRKLT